MRGRAVLTAASKTAVLSLGVSSALEIAYGGAAPVWGRLLWLVLFLVSAVNLLVFCSWNAIACLRGDDKEPRPAVTVGSRPGCCSPPLPPPRPFDLQAGGVHITMSGGQVKYVSARSGVCVYLGVACSDACSRREEERASVRSRPYGSNRSC